MFTNRSFWTVTSGICWSSVLCECNGEDRNGARFVTTNVYDDEAKQNMNMHSGLILLGVTYSLGVTGTDFRITGTWCYVDQVLGLVLLGSYVGCQNVCLMYRSRCQNFPYFFYSCCCFIWGVYWSPWPNDSTWFALRTWSRHMHFMCMWQW